MNADRIHRLVAYALVCARESGDAWHDSLAIIHLLKYAYLGDLEWAKLHSGESWTGVSWRFHHFGPYDEDAVDAIGEALAELDVEAIFRDHVKAEEMRREFRYLGEEERQELERGIDLPVRLAIRLAVRRFGNDSPALLDEVYRTPPMLHAAPGEFLDLAADLPGPATSVEVPTPARLTDKQKKKRSEALAALRSRVTASLDHGLARRSLAGRAPRYDDTFAEGTQWLDSLAGEPPPTGSGTFDVDDSVWRSPTRRERLP